MVQWLLQLAALLLLRVAAGIPVLPEVQLAASEGASENVRELAERLATGQGLVCCGYWRDEAARHLQERLAAELGVPARLLSDVRLVNASTSVRAGGQADAAWGASAVLFLDEPEEAAGAMVTLATMVGEGAEGGELGDPVVAPRGALVVVPDGGQLLHGSPRRVAVLRVRREGSPGSSAFDYYAGSWVRKNFVAPHETGAERRFFRRLTRHPRFWHTFVWSFLGIFSTVFAVLPLFRWMQKLAEQMARPEPEPPLKATIRSSSGTLLAGPPTPTRLWLVHYSQKLGGEHRLLPPDIERGGNVPDL